MDITKQNIFEEALKGNPKVLESPLIECLVDGLGNSPLHYFSYSKKVDILQHPLVDTLKNKKGVTPFEIYNNVTSR